MIDSAISQNIVYAAPQIVNTSGLIPKNFCQLEVLTNGAVILSGSIKLILILKQFMPTDINAIAVFGYEKYTNHDYDKTTYNCSWNPRNVFDADGGDVFFMQQKG